MGLKAFTILLLFNFLTSMAVAGSFEATPTHIDENCLRQMKTDYTGELDVSLLCRKMDPQEFDEKSFLQLCEQLYEANTFLEDEGAATKLKCREAIDKSKQVRATTNEQSPYLTVSQGAYSVLNLIFNGRVMFLGASYNNRIESEKPEISPRIRDYGLIIDDDGQVSVIDQNKLFIESLPLTVSMSRCMSNWESRRWAQGTFNMNEFRGDRLHFGYGQFHYNQKNCWQFQIPRRVLENLDKQNLLEINTYDYASSFSEKIDNPGMTPSSYGPMGIPFEIVIFFKEGADQIKEYLRKGVRF